MSKATQILISELHQPIWGPMTSVLHLKTDDQGTGVGKIPQMSQPGVAVHPPLSSPEARGQLDGWRQLAALGSHRRSS